MVDWREVWRESIAPQLSVHELSFLRDAVAKNDKRLIQGSTCNPPALPCVRDWPAIGGCLFGLLAFRECESPKTAEVEASFARVVVGANSAGAPCDTDRFLDFFDDTPRDRMLAELLPEIETELLQRGSQSPLVEGMA
jgi:hypothetical protein